MVSSWRCPFRYQQRSHRLLVAPFFGIWGLWLVHPVEHGTWSHVRRVWVIPWEYMGMYEEGFSYFVYFECRVFQKAHPGATRGGSGNACWVEGAWDEPLTAN